MSSFANIILPLPVQGTFTYRIPDSLDGRVQMGMRVLVPFGRKKIYTGIVLTVHHNEPTEYAVKDICELLDTFPIQQL